MSDISCRPIRIVSVSLLVTISISTAGSAFEKPTALDEYVAAADKSYDWTFESTSESDRGRVHRMTLISQTWQDIIWRHRLLVIEPRRITHADQVLLFITGGSTGREP
ncbi:uncharacterized protein METZ01_LOCUS385994, partial [marine metagenome]